MQNLQACIERAKAQYNAQTGAVAVCRHPHCIEPADSTARAVADRIYCAVHSGWQWGHMWCRTCRRWRPPVIPAGRTCQECLDKTQERRQKRKHQHSPAEQEAAEAQPTHPVDGMGSGNANHYPQGAAAAAAAAMELPSFTLGAAPAPSSHAAVMNGAPGPSTALPVAHNSVPAAYTHHYQQQQQQQNMSLGAGNPMPAAGHAAGPFTMLLQSASEEAGAPGGAFGGALGFPQVDLLHPTALPGNNRAFWKGATSCSGLEGGVGPATAAAAAVFTAPSTIIATPGPAALPMTLDPVGGTAEVHVPGSQVQAHGAVPESSSQTDPVQAPSAGVAAEPGYYQQQDAAASPTTTSDFAAASSDEAEMEEWWSQNLPPLEELEQMAFP